MSSQAWRLEARETQLDDARVRYGVLEEKVPVRPGRFRGRRRRLSASFGCTAEHAKSRWALNIWWFLYCVLYCIRSVIRGPAFMRPPSTRHAYLPHTTTGHTEQRFWRDVKSPFDR